MLDEYAKKRMDKAGKTPDLRQILSCPYCHHDVTDSQDAEYLKMKSGHETFFHRSCLAKALKEVMK